MYCLTVEHLLFLLKNFLFAWKVKEIFEPRIELGTFSVLD
jgi:hypothetical protein